MNSNKKRYFFNLAGICIIVSWLVMIGILAKKNSFNNIDEDTDFTYSLSNIKSAERDWMEIFLKGKKVGYSVSLVNPFGDDFFIQEEIFLKLNLMGQTSIMHTTTKSVVDKKLLLKNFRFTMDSGVVTFQVSGKVDGNKMLLEIGEGSKRRHESIILTGRPVIGSGMGLFFKERRLDIGQSFKFLIFDASTLAQKEMVINVTAREPMVINSVAYSAFRLETDMWGQKMVFWLDEKGEVLKEEGFTGLTLIRSDEDRAPRDISGSEEGDLYELAAINVSIQLHNPEKLAYLKLETEGLETADFDTDILNEGRQRFKNNTLEIVKEEIPQKAPYLLPYHDLSGEMGPYIQPEYCVESDNDGIIDKSRDIAGDVKNPVIAARKLMAWVFKKVKKRPVISVPSAIEVLKTRVGDCNEHSVLLTALLRAVGIPGRLCVGLVYSRGKFFYHAWTECYLGEWVSMDATLNQMPVDATHIKLVQGGLERQVQLIGLIGNLKMKVIAYGYDKIN